MVLVHTYIFIHSQDILLKYIQRKKFSELTNPLYYVFVGNRPLDKSLFQFYPTVLENLIVCREYTDHLEHFPLLCSFTGWYILYKHVFLTLPKHERPDYISLFEYDVCLETNFQQNREDLCLSVKPMLVGYISLPIHDPMYLLPPEYDFHPLMDAIKKTYHWDILEWVNHQENFEKVASVTMNYTFRLDCFYMFMDWVCPLLSFIIESPWAGHIIERCVSLFYFFPPHKAIEEQCVWKWGAVIHAQMDSHGTQRTKLENMFHRQEMWKMIYRSKS